MTSATERLRALLDERGVEHFDATECTLWGYEQTSDSTGCYRCAADEVGEGFMTLRMHHLTPEQAVAATLGRGECHNKAPEYLDFLCSECGFVHYHSGANDTGDGNEWNYCPNCGRRCVG